MADLLYKEDFKNRLNPVILTSIIRAVIFVYTGHYRNLEEISLVPQFLRSLW